MYDAWSLVGVGGGSAALTWIAAGRQQGKDGNSLRLSLDSGGSLLGDVRVIGAALTAAVSMYTSGTTKKAMQTIAAASLLSVLQTEIMRFRLVRQQEKEGTVRFASKLPLGPAVAFGALNGPAANQNANVHASQGAWAGR